jgi:hypothetical protein
MSYMENMYGKLSTMKNVKFVILISMNLGSVHVEVAKVN